MILRHEHALPDPITAWVRRDGLSIALPLWPNGGEHLPRSSNWVHIEVEAIHVTLVRGGRLWPWEDYRYGWTTVELTKAGYEHYRDRLVEAFVVHATEQRKERSWSPWHKMTDEQLVNRFDRYAKGRFTRILKASEKYCEKLHDTAERYATVFKRAYSV